jgi:hypothetical protein
MNDETAIQTNQDAIFDVAAWLGRKQAFAELAGRCSAADAECLRQVRDGKKYLALKMSWKEFCKRRLGLSRGTANSIIKRLEEFGPQYFILAQATGIKPEQYRRIQSSVRGQKLLHAGEEIPIEPKNAPRLSAAVEELRRVQKADSNAGPRAGEQAGMIDAPAPAASVPEDLNRALDKLERALAAAIDEIARLHALRLGVDLRERLLRSVIAQLHRIPIIQLTEMRRVS